LSLGRGNVMTKPVEFLRRSSVYLKGAELPEVCEIGSKEFTESQFDPSHLAWLRKTGVVKPAILIPEVGGFVGPKGSPTPPAPVVEEVFVSAVPEELRSKPVEVKAKPKAKVKRAAAEVEELPEISGGIKDAGIQQRDEIEKIIPPLPGEKIPRGLPAAMYFDDEKDMAHAMTNNEAQFPDIERGGVTVFPETGVTVKNTVLKDMGNVQASEPIFPAASAQKGKVKR
jgi:hypothetical protein